MKLTLHTLRGGRIAERMDFTTSRSRKFKEDEQSKF